MQKTMLPFLFFSTNAPKNNSTAHRSTFVSSPLEESTTTVHPSLNRFSFNEINHSIFFIQYDMSSHSYKIVLQSNEAFLLSAIYRAKVKLIAECIITIKE